MFGMGFMEIFLVLIVAIIALGPEKLPGALVEGAKFFKKVKNGLSDAKSTLDKELNIKELKEEAAQLKAGVSNFQNMTNLDLELLDDDVASKNEATPQKPTEIKKEEPKESKKESISLDRKRDV